MANRSFQSVRSDVYRRITDDIVAAIEQGAGEWQMPWHHDGSSIARPRNVASDKAYRGINIVALRVAAHRAGYTSGIWGTYRQWAERGCQVRRGETAMTVVFWKRLGGSQDDDSSENADPSDHDEGGRRPRFLARGYSIFNEAQVDGYLREELPCLPESERIARADTFFAALNIPMGIGGNDACYRPDIDTIFMPPFEHFFDAASFYSCLYHESGHAVGHPSRLDRDLTGRFGSANYAMDEVRADFKLRPGRSRDCPPTAGRACSLHFVVAQRAQVRPARNFHRRRQGTAGRGLDACPAARRECIRRPSPNADPSLRDRLSTVGQRAAQ
jgi:antirestriction protein ArdC